MPTPITQDPNDILANALAKYRAGLDPTLIELPEKVVFPHLIPLSPVTGRKARSTGLLLGRPAPRFTKRSRTIRYRLSDLLAWLADADDFTSTADVMARTNASNCDCASTSQSRARK